MQATGEDEFNSKHVCHYTHWLLGKQHADGSWYDHAHRPPGHDAYDVLHLTWTALLGIRSRHFLPESPWHRRMRVMLESIAKSPQPHVGSMAMAGAGTKVLRPVGRQAKLDAVNSVLSEEGARALNELAADGAASLEVVNDDPTVLTDVDDDDDRDGTSHA